MCGIAGILDRSGAPVAASDIERMLAPIRHRGPDESGVRTLGCAGLGHVRLSIIDVAGGRQPMGSPDDAVWLTFNGEVFNYLELREELEGLGHAFATRSDTEVLLRAYLHWGGDCVRHFNGQWAFAIWDGRSQILFCSRDRLGVRPLFFTTAGRRFLFASEVKSLFADPAVSRGFDLHGIEQVFTTWTVLAPRTVFRGVSQVPPGHSMTVGPDGVKMTPYWDLDFPEPDTRTPAPELAGRLHDLLSDATRLRLRSDVPVGAYLSGGLDSTIVTALARLHTSGPLRTFSVTFEDPEFDESDWQRRVIDYLGVDHQSVQCRASDIGASFPDAVWHAEQPLVRTAPVPLFLLSRRVREAGFKVVLTGEGADEGFAGYDLFKEARIRRLVAEHPGEDHASLLRRLYPYLPGLQAQPDAYLEAFFRASPGDLADPFFSHQPRWNLTSRIASFFSDEIRAELAGHDVRRELARMLPPAFPAWDPLGQAQYLEARLLLPGYILSSQGDRMAMAHSVEGRFPFLDHRVVEFATRLPPDLRLSGMDEKHLLKRAMVGRIPDFLAQRPKQPYRAPDAPCFFDPATGRGRFPWVEDLLGEDAIRGTGLFQPEAVGLLARKAARGRISGVRDGMALTAILSTQILAFRMIEGRKFGGDED
jgi:asparagine synthase (glutamine-hydrolysing)